MISKYTRSIGGIVVLPTSKLVTTSQSLPVKTTEASSNIKISKYHGEITRNSDGTVDIRSEIEKHPDFLWIKVKAIKADEENDKGDFFSREEIRKAYKTFEGCPVFTNHENQHVEKAKGKVVMAEWNEEEGIVYCTMFIDREAYPDLARAIEAGYVTDVSMGTQVDYSICSQCGNKAMAADSYCDHIKTMKGRKLNGQKIYEKNYGLKFIEISVVTDGACKDCTIQEVFDPSDFVDASKKTKEAADSIRKLIKTGLLTKDAGPKEIAQLNESLDLLENVAKSMLDQREVIDMDFLKDLADVIASAQHLVDELVDQGYGSVGSSNQPPEIPSTIPNTPEIANLTQPAMQEEEKLPQKAILTGPTGMGVGKVTEPTKAESCQRTILLGKIKDLKKKSEKYLEENNKSSGGNEVSNPEKYKETINKLSRIWENPSVKDFKTEALEGNFKIVIGKDEAIGLMNGEKIASLSISNLDPDVKAILDSDPKGTASKMLDALKEKFMSQSSEKTGVVKVAEKAPSNANEQHQQTMEVQLEKQRVPLHPREDETRQNITEKQLSGGWRSYDFLKRVDNPKNVITEKQLDKGDPKAPEDLSRQDKPRDQITEEQLRDSSIKGNITPADKPSFVDGVHDQKQQTTEGQLSDWKDKKTINYPSSITEKQVGEQKEPWGRRIASKEDAKKALSSGMKALVKTAIATGATPEELVNASMEFLASPSNTIRSIEYSDLIDNPNCREERETILRRAMFHGPLLKTANKDFVQNYLLGSLVDSGMTGETSLKVLSSLVNRGEAIEKISVAIASGLKEELVSSQQTPHDFIKEALAEEFEEEVKVILNKNDVKIDSKNEEELEKHAFDSAEKIALSQGIKVTKRIKVANKKDTIEVSFMGKKVDIVENKVVEAETETEPKETKIASSKEERRKIVEAQMPAGGMPGDPMSPGGTTMPMPPAADPMGAPAGGVAPTGIPAMTTSEPEAMEDEETDSGEALPPGSFCPACKSEDVDIKGGEISCNNCGASGTIQVKIDMNEWPGILEEKGPGGENKGESEEEGLPLPDLGIAAYYKITPEMVRISSKNEDDKFGKICPHCHSQDVKLSMSQGSGSGKCNNCNEEYKVDLRLNTKTNDVWAKISWNDSNFRKMAKIEYLKQKNDKGKMLSLALKDKGLEAKFAKADLSEKAEIISKLHNEGLI